MLKISSQGVSNLEKTKGQYFLSKESYFFTLCQLGCSDIPEPKRGPEDPRSGAGALVLDLFSCGRQELEAGGASWAVDIPTSTPCTLVAHHQGGLHSHGKGTPRGSGGHGPHPRCSKVGQLLMGAPGEVEGLNHIDPFSFTFLLLSPSSLFTPRPLPPKKEYHSF